MTEYENLISSLRRKVGPLNLEEIVALIAQQEISAEVLAPGTVARSVAGRLAETVSIFDVVPTAQHAAIIARTSTYDVAADLATALARGRVTLPDGKYYINSNVTMPAGSALIGPGLRPTGGVEFAMQTTRSIIPANGCVISGIRFSGAASAAIYPSTSAAVTDLLVTECYFDGVAQGLKIDRPGSSTHSGIRVVNNTFNFCSIGCYGIRLAYSFIIHNRFINTSGRNIALDGGNGNLIALNQINGGITGIALVYDRSTAGTAGVFVGNRIVSNAIRGVTEESIGLDARGNIAASTAALETDTVASKANPAGTTYTVTLTHAGWSSSSSMAGYYVVFTTGALRGRAALISAHTANSAVFTIKVNAAEYARIAAADEIVIGAPFLGNDISHNNIEMPVSTSAVGISLWGMCVGNTVSANTVLNADQRASALGIRAESLAGITSTGSVTAKRRAPCMNNNISHNNLAMADLRLGFNDYGSDPYYSFGNKAADNNIMGQLTLVRNEDCTKDNSYLSKSVSNEPSAKTANYTVLSNDNRQCFTNVGASGTVTFTLPAAAVGLEYTFYRSASQAVRVDPNGSETIGTGTGGQYAELQSDKGLIRVKCIVAGHWAILDSAGTVAYA